ASGGTARGGGDAGCAAATVPPGAAGARWGGAAATGDTVAPTGTGAAPATGLTAKTVLHTAQRARTPPAGTLAGSTRYTVSHDGQLTFTLASRR
ncbi:MAG TPA: hypothetical protein VGV12_08455, partial [Gemmatimonadales bacterium]|nr:hypothetical protein [Gemmatimonadales bacterium]